MFEINGLAEAVPSSFRTVPAGRYTCRIVKIEEGETQGNSKYPGTPKLQIKAQIIEGDHTGHNFMFSVVVPVGDAIDKDPEYKAGQLSKLAKFLEVCGIDRSKGGFDPEDLSGAELILAVDLKKDANGESQNNVKNYIHINKV